jgi:hypothetical protein
MLDPQVQIRIIDLALQLAKDSTNIAHVSATKWYDTTIENFDKTYKAILKTISEK